MGVPNVSTVDSHEPTTNEWMIPHFSIHAQWISVDHQVCRCGDPTASEGIRRLAMAVGWWWLVVVTPAMSCPKWWGFTCLMWEQATLIEGAQH